MISATPTCCQAGKCFISRTHAHSHPCTSPVAYRLCAQHNNGAALNKDQLWLRCNLHFDVVEIDGQCLLCLLTKWSYVHDMQADNSNNSVCSNMWPIHGTIINQAAKMILILHRGTCSIKQWPSITIVQSLPFSKNCNVSSGTGYGHGSVCTDNVLKLLHNTSWVLHDGRTNIARQPQQHATWQKTHKPCTYFLRSNQPRKATTTVPREKQYGTFG